jgi:hypothetical protein
LQSSQAQFTQDILTKSELYWASPLSFNDPFDCAPVHVLAGSRVKKELAIRRIIRNGMPFLSRHEVKARTLEAMLRPPQAIEDMMSELQARFMANTGVCCLSTIPDNILMWSHYADSHRGICLRFTAEAKRSAYPNLDDLHFELSFPVQYSDLRPEINILWKDRTDLLEKMLLIKADFWSYEHEWRMFRSNAGPGTHKFPSQCLDGIIFGARSTADDGKMVGKWLKDRQHPVKMYQANFSKKFFRLNIEEL